MLGELDIYNLLDERAIPYDAFSHEAVFTVEAAEALDLPHEGPDASVPMKNLFLRDDKKRAFFLLVAPAELPVDLKELQRQLGSRRLSFASAELLRHHLGVEQGSVTPLGLLNDEEHRVTLVLDERLRHQRIDAHPLVNTATLTLSADDVCALVSAHGNPVRWCAPTLPEEPAQGR